MNTDPDNVEIDTGLHGFHIHTNAATGSGGSLFSCGGSSTGGHYNPFGVTHGNRDDAVRHVGDLGNIRAVDDGAGGTVAELDWTDPQASLFGDDSIMGRSIVIHATNDKLDIGPTGSPSYSGGSGSRVACGTIGFASAAQAP